MPGLSRFRPEDAGQPLKQEAVDHVIDDIVYLLRRDPNDFWSKTTGAPAEEIAKRKVPVATARSFVRSLFMVFPEHRSFYEGDPEQAAILQGALDTLERYSGGFDHTSQGDVDGGRRT